MALGWRNSLFGAFRYEAGGKFFIGGCSVWRAVMLKVEVSKGYCDGKLGENRKELRYYYMRRMG